MVTAEIAAAIPVLVVLLAAALTAIDVVGGQLGCVDAAREAARGAARGDPDSAARSAGLQAAPRGATIGITHGSSRITVVVQASIRPVGALLPAFTVSARAVAEGEPGIGPS